MVNGNNHKVTIVDLSFDKYTDQFNRLSKSRWIDERNLRDLTRLRIQSANLVQLIDNIKSFSKFNDCTTVLFYIERMKWNKAELSDYISILTKNPNIDGMYGSAILNEIVELAEASPNPFESYLKLLGRMTGNVAYIEYCNKETSFDTILNKAILYSQNIPEKLASIYRELSHLRMPDYCVPKPQKHYSIKKICCRVAKKLSFLETLEFIKCAYHHELVYRGLYDFFQKQEPGNDEDVSYANEVSNYALVISQVYDSDLIALLCCKAKSAASTTQDFVLLLKSLKSNGKKELPFYNQFVVKADHAAKTAQDYQSILPFVDKYSSMYSHLMFRTIQLAPDKAFLLDMIENKN